MISSLFAALPLCVLPHDPTATAAPLPSALDGLRTEFVPADARLVLHFDVQGLLHTQLWKALTGPDGLVDLEHEAKELIEFKNQFGVDPLTDILGVTLWSSSEDLEPEAAILTTTGKIDTALGALRLAPGYRTEPHDGIEVQFFSFEEHHEAEGTRVHVSVESEAVAAYVHPLSSGERAIVVAETPERVVRAAKVLRGEAPSLASAKGVSFQARPRPGSFLFGATLGGLPKNLQPASQIFGLAQGIQFDLGEAGGSFFAHAALSAADAELARKVKDSAAGLVAMGQLILGAQEEVPQGVRELLGAIHVSQSETVVDVEFSYATSGLIDLLRSLQAMDAAESGEDSEEDK
jgi:hypothetical protein